MITKEKLIEELKSTFWAVCIGLAATLIYFIQEWAVQFFDKIL